MVSENSKKRISFNTGCVTNVTFLEGGSNCDIFKQASENNPKICKISTKALGNGLNQLLAYVVPNLPKAWHSDFIEYVAK